MSTCSSGFSTTFNGESRIVAIVIPCYKVSRHIVDLLARIGPECDRIYIVDDCCPENSGRLVEKTSRDLRVTVLYHPKNHGVGGAMITGYQRAMKDGAHIIVKMDGDGQMDPHLLNYLISPIIAGKADYTKGNRFYDLKNTRQMPSTRIVGNAALSFLSKLSTGYWGIFDPTNGYTAIHAKVASRLPFDKISNRFFFETDMLFRLNSLRAVVLDIPMDAKYGDETSNLHISRVIVEFFFKHCRNFCKRIFYNYFLRDCSIGTLELICGALLVQFGSLFGLYHWIESARKGIPATTGTVMLAAVPFIVGMQYLLAFFSCDMASVPKEVLHSRLSVVESTAAHK